MEDGGEAAKDTTYKCHMFEWGGRWMMGGGGGAAKDTTCERHRFEWEGRWRMGEGGGGAAKDTTCERHRCILPRDVFDLALGLLVLPHNVQSLCRVGASPVGPWTHRYLLNTHRCLLNTHTGTY